MATTVVLNISGKGPHRIGTDLTQQELAAIGMVTVLWAELEHTLFDVTMALAEFTGTPVPPDTSSLPFSKRLKALRTLIKETAKNPEGQKEFLDLLTQISNLERSRNRITHGLWNWNLSDPVTSKVNSTRAPHTFQESFDFHKLIKVAHKIGEITFKLLYPGGEDQVHEEQMAQMDQGPIFSRHFALTAVGVDLTSTHPFPENRPKPKKVRPTRQKSANQDQT